MHLVNGFDELPRAMAHDLEMAGPNGNIYLNSKVNAITGHNQTQDNQIKVMSIRGRFWIWSRLMLDRFIALDMSRESKFSRRFLH